MLDERAADLERRAARLEELQQDTSRDVRRQSLLAQRSTLGGAVLHTLTRARDDTRRATEGISAAMADGMNSILITAPTGVQQFSREVDRLMAPLHKGARDMFGISLSRPSSFKGRRAAFADELSGEVGASGGDNFEPTTVSDLPEQPPSERRQRRDN